MLNHEERIRFAELNEGRAGLPLINMHGDVAENTVFIEADQFHYSYAAFLDSFPDLVQIVNMPIMSGAEQKTILPASIFGMIAKRIEERKNG